MDAAWQRSKLAQAVAPCALNPVTLSVVNHTDHSKHSVQIVVTEQGVADLRGKDPHERAQLIINNCAHPACRDQLHNYLKLTKVGHAPLVLDLSFATHRVFLASGDMRKTAWGSYR